jgi:integrase
VWLAQEVRALIGTGTTGRVFDVTVAELQAVMRTACKKLKVERATPHDLRRTHGTTITALGFGRDALNRIQNHVEGGIASVYDRHRYSDENKRIMEAVAARILELAGERQPQSNVVPFEQTA